MDNPSYEADEKGSVHLQSIKRIKEPDNLKVRQSKDTYTNRYLKFTRSLFHILKCYFFNQIMSESRRRYPQKPRGGEYETRK